MLRLFKLTSPMNVGAWILTGSGGAFTAAFVRARLRRLPRLGRACGVAGGRSWAPRCARTRPSWSPIPRSRRGTRRASSCRSCSPAARSGPLEPPPASSPRLATPPPARRVAITGAALELLAAQAMERHLGELGQPYHEGRSGRFARAAKSLSVAGAAVIAARGSGRGGAAAGGALVLAGSLCERFAIYHAGFESARDPQATVAPQRARAGDYN